MFEEHVHHQRAVTDAIDAFVDQLITTTGPEADPNIVEVVAPLAAQLEDMLPEDPHVHELNEQVSAPAAAHEPSAVGPAARPPTSAQLTIEQESNPAAPAVGTSDLSVP